jgi:hypothetical protein
MEQSENPISDHLSNNDIPKYITINNFEYIFKERKINNNFSYRCRKRKCGIIININELNLKKIINKNSNGNLEYTKITKKEHTCKDNILNTSFNNIKLEVEEIKLVEHIIKKNLDKSFQWHIYII